MEWVVAESWPSDEADVRTLRRKWEDVAEDMALIPELNVRVNVVSGVVRVEVSEELYDCMRGL
ncbi:MAG: hypothetical protein PHV85_01975 [Desulfovibrionaceae bacterium]|nr:hypothetical protein [Desulfovibrionaceae bacterium]MDD4951294.1 hypothetical protein [Desulfovibrionaceae bacterium]